MTQEGSIYCLKDPDTGQVCYVGQTRRAVNVRIKQHIYDCKSYRTKKDVWLRALIEAKRLPVVELLEVCQTADLDERERYWLSIFSENNPAITNGRNPPRPYSQRRGEAVYIVASVTEDEKKLAVSLAKDYDTDVSTIVRLLLQYADEHRPPLVQTRVLRGKVNALA